MNVYRGTDAHGRPIRSHLTGQIHDEEAAIVRRIFELCAQGYGVKRIARLLNDAGAPSPRAQQARRDGWAASSVRTVLYRELYRGVVVWNRTQKRNVFGEKQPHAREQRKAAIDRELRAAGVATFAAGQEVRKLRALLAERLKDWRGLLERQTDTARQVIQQVLVGKITFTPTRGKMGAPAYTITAPLTFERLVAGILCPCGGTSPAGPSVRWMSLEGVTEYLRAA